MVQENNETTPTDSSATATGAASSTTSGSSRRKKAVAPKYDAVQESDPSVLTVYKFTSRYGTHEDGNRKEYKVAAESLRAAARLVGIKSDSVTQTGVEEYSSD